MKRKSNNRARRNLLCTRAALRSNCVAVVNVGERQGLVHWKNLKSIGGSHRIADGICDLAHHWTIYLAVFCQAQSGERYIKADEIAPAGMHRSEKLVDVMEHYHDELTATCNPTHVVGRGWIALPYPVSLTEEQADRVFDAVGAWNSKEAS